MTTDAELFSKNAKAVLDKAGKPLTHQETADILNISLQDVFDRIAAKEIISVEYQKTPVIPSIQFQEKEGRHDIVPGVSWLLQEFVKEGAGTWSALQFLTQPDGNLQGQTPIDVLKNGDTQAIPAVRHATLAYLD